MAFKLIATNGQVQYNVDEFVVDSLDDFKSLPTRSAMGSTALCLSDSNVYVKNSKQQWVLLGGSDSGGGSGGGDSAPTGPISYNDLIDKPSINETVVQGQIGIDTIPTEVIDEMFNNT